MNQYRQYNKQQKYNQQDEQALNDFYKLHYPSKKSPQAVSKASNKMRSKSVVSVLQSSANEEPQPYNPKGSIRKMVANNEVRSHSMFNKDAKQPIKFKEMLSFKTILSTKTNPRDLNSVILPFNSLKDVEELAKKNLNVRLAMQRSKDEKIKMNKIVMSHKQTQQVKLEYLKTKKQEVEMLINQQINSIYEEFFRKQYQSAYGVEEGEDRFQVKLAELVAVLSRRVFNSN